MKLTLDLAKNTRKALLFVSAVFVLNGCSTIDNLMGGDDDKAPLEGERISVLELQSALEPDTLEDGEQITLPDPWRNEYWPQAGGYANHAMQHLALNPGKLEKLWDTRIGKGASKAMPLTAQPIVIDGKVFTLDADSTLTALSLDTGKELWRRDVRDKDEDDPVIGGGIAYAKGKIYITNGYNEILTLAPSDGALLWRTALPSAARAAPTITDERVFVSTLDNRLIAMDATDGHILWDFSGVSESTALLGAASPAAGYDIVVPAFSSGEIFALRTENGSISWGENLSPFRRARGLAGLTDISALPIIDKNMIIATSFSGQIVALDIRTGQRLWQREVGSAKTPWIAGDYLFMLSTDNEAVALDRKNGAILWVTPLPRYENPKKKKDAIFWSAPVLAGGRLILAGSNGDVVEISPADGSITSRWEAGKGFSVAPLVAGEVLYLLDDSGTLHAYK